MERHHFNSTVAGGRSAVLALNIQLLHPQQEAVERGRLARAKALLLVLTRQAEKLLHVGKPNLR